MPPASVAGYSWRVPGTGDREQGNAGISAADIGAAAVGGSVAGDGGRVPDGHPRVEQASLFPEFDPVPIPVDLGYRWTVACEAAGITYRQLDHWARTGLVEPSIRPAAGSGSQRLYSFRDILVLRIVKRLLDTGVSLGNIRAAVTHLSNRGGEDLVSITLMSDGASIYECRSAEDVVDLVRGGQGVFGIAVGSVWREVEGTLSTMPGERTDVTHAEDELARRRAARGVRAV